MLKVRSTVDSDAGHSTNGEVHHQNVAGLAARIVAGGMDDLIDRGIGEDRGVEPGRRFRFPVEHQADRVLCDATHGRVAYREPTQREANWRTILADTRSGPGFLPESALSCATSCYDVFFVAPFLRRNVLEKELAKLNLGVSQSLFAASLVLCLTGAASASWTVTNLHPTGFDYSEGLGASGSQQAGVVQSAGAYRAALWNATAPSYVDLHPTTMSESFAYGASGTQQAGFARDASGVDYASLWNGSAASWTSLHPASASRSSAYAISGGQQAGVATFSGTDHAGIWSGTASSWVSLHPSVALTSAAFATNGTQQAGYAVLITGDVVAGMWSGTAASWVDLNPATATSSAAYGIGGSQQVGVATVGGVTRASLWTGSSASWVDLNPASATYGHAYMTNGSSQVGYVNYGAGERASLWTGSAASIVDLHAVLPSSFANSFARSISSDGFNYYITGTGFNTATSQYEALLWTQPVPEPASMAALGLGLAAVAARGRRKR